MKGSLSRTRIQECACRLFSEKGFSNTTMSDICEAAGLSRGGLYRHYASTKDIYLDWLSAETAQSDSVLQGILQANKSAKEVLSQFLRNETARLSQRTGIPDTSIYELCKLYPECIPLMEMRIDTAMVRLEKIIVLGNEQGHFDCPSPQAAATTILAFLQGLGALQPFAKLSSHQLAQQLETVCSCLGGDLSC